MSDDTKLILDEIAGLKRDVKEIQFDQSDQF